MSCVHCDQRGPLFPVLEGEAAQIAARLVPGVRVKVVENTYRPEKAGEVKRVVDVGERLITFRTREGHRIRSSVAPDSHWVGPDTYRFHTVCENGVRHSATHRLLGAGSNRPPKEATDVASESPGGPAEPNEGPLFAARDGGTS